MTIRFENAKSIVRNFVVIAQAFNVEASPSKLSLSVSRGENRMSQGKIITKLIRWKFSPEMFRSTLHN